MTPRPGGAESGWKQARTENRTPLRALTPEAAPSVLAHKAARVILAPLISLGLRAVGYKITDEPADLFRAPCSSQPGIPSSSRERQEQRREILNPLDLYRTLASCFSGSSLSTQSISYCYFCLSFPLTLYFLFPLVSPPCSPSTLPRFKVKTLHKTPFRDSHLLRRIQSWFSSPPSAWSRATCVRGAEVRDHEGSHELDSGHVGPSAG